MRFSILTFALLCAVFIAQGQENHPNILLIIADDLGIDVMNGYQENDRMPKTPNLDALSDSGVRFSNAWSTPQCTPTRAAIMSGKYGVNTGVMRPPGNLDLEHTSLFTKIENATNNAYADAVIGKWHISQPTDYSHPGQHSIDHYEGLFTATVENYFLWDKVVDEMLSESNEYVTSDLTDAAIDWVNEQSNPWFLWLAHVAPHSPFHIPPDELHSRTDTTDNLGKYLAAIEAMDHEIGRLLESLDPVTSENTIIIFVGDNGTPGGVIQNFPGNHSKGTIYEGGVRVPMIISGKGVRRFNEVDENLVHVADLYATILEVAGVQLNGGINNSMSLKPLLECDGDLGRQFVYTDYEDADILFWAIRNQEYKLIEGDDGTLEFYKIAEDILEENDLIGNMSGEEEELMLRMQDEAQVIRSGWSCTDGIQNGDENAIDDCEDDCEDENEISATNIGCCEVPGEPSVYYEYIELDSRNIYTNNFPNHEYCYNNDNQMPEQTHHNFSMALDPEIAENTSSILNQNGRPRRYFGVAKNGVIFAPAPAAPFIFEDQNTGEFNWDWVFEPTNNQGSGPTKVGLDCASAHTGGQGYHYHGNMFAYVDNEVMGISSTHEVPDSTLHIGWASDGFPILYRFGPDKDGNLKELLPSYQLKSGLRPGDGIEAPCGAYSGKYTADYEYLCGKGDLDECNGIESQVSIPTANGIETFEYFYVITSLFPQISRCLVGDPSLDFENSNDPLMGVDNDNDGFLSDYDCDDDDPEINPLADEIFGNDIDENCDGILTSLIGISADEFTIGPNPSNETFIIYLPPNEIFDVEIYAKNAVLVRAFKAKNDVSMSGFIPGVYLIKITSNTGDSIVKKQIIQ